MLPLLRRYLFNQALDVVKYLTEGKKVGTGAPLQYTVTRKYRRRIARSMVKINLAAAK